MSSPEGFCRNLEQNFGVHACETLEFEEESFGVKIATLFFNSAKVTPGIATATCDKDERLFFYEDSIMLHTKHTFTIFFNTAGGLNVILFFNL